MCKCDCGNLCEINGGRLRSGNTKSCGCLRREVPASKFKDISGQKFGMLTAISVVGHAKNGHLIWKCLCDCGRYVDVDRSNLVSGGTKSCGCYRREVTSQNHLIHGESKQRLHRVWYGMKERCYDKNHISYHLYGGRGIEVCQEWRDSYSSFREWAISSGYDENAMRGECTLDRIDVNGNYSPENCRWVPMSVQNRNRRNNATKDI